MSFTFSVIGIMKENVIYKSGNNYCIMIFSSVYFAELEKSCVNSCKRHSIMKTTTIAIGVLMIVQLSAAQVRRHQQKLKKIIIIFWLHEQIVKLWLITFDFMDWYAWNEEKYMLFLSKDNVWLNFQYETENLEYVSYVVTRTADVSIIEYALYLRIQWLYH